jgi:hypothetical protein
MKNRAFLVTFFAAFIFIMSLLALINFFIDPWDYFQHRFEFLERHDKFKVKAYQRMVKAQDIKKIKPQSLILGTSHVMEGINPKSVEDRTGLVTYNVGLFRTNMEEIHAYFDYALAQQADVKLILIGIDVYSFNRFSTCGQDFSKERLNRAFYLKDGMDSLFSFNALNCSFATIKNKFFNKKAQIFFDHSGWVTEDCLKQHYAHLPKSYADTARESLKDFITPEEVYGHFELSESSMNLFKDIVKKCREKNIQLHVFITPCKAAYWQALEEKKIWDDVERLKRYLVKYVDIFDMSGVYSYTSGSFLEWTPEFWDFAHFSPVIGDKIVEILIRKTNDESLGVWVNESNIEDHLLKQKEKLKQWALQHPDEVSIVREIIF